MNSGDGWSAAGDRAGGAATESRADGARTRVRATIAGRVQGIGFRPAVYRHAVACSLTGYVRNDPGGVTLEVEGREGDVSLFFERLEESVPARASILRLETERLPLEGYERFDVVASETRGAVTVQLPPDLATCGPCLSEMRDYRDRRFRYPFINCVDCGPRFTILRDLPYDRANTSMHTFRLCPDCGREYADPGDRRFHAEPNACPVCGPRLTLLGSDGRPVAEREDALRQAQALLRRGAIVAVKGLGGYHLACDAFDVDAVDRLRARKERPHKTLAVMFRDLAVLRERFRVTPPEEDELLSAARPIVVLDGLLGPGISPDTDDTGVFLPYTPLHHLLMEEFEALVLTSGNHLEEPIAQDEDQVAVLLGEGIADAALTHDRLIQHRCDDSVVRFVDGERRFLRRARGFVPTPIPLAAGEPGAASSRAGAAYCAAVGSPVILGTGGDLKSTFCLAVEGNAYVSQHIGDLADHATNTFFEEEIQRWLALLRVKPEFVAHDLHPGYLSTRYASRLESVPLIGVQHHHAHIAGVMAECGLQEPVLGVALDGTGYGPDGTVWGGEFLVADLRAFERLARFRRYPLPGGEKAIDEPWRMAVSVCHGEGIDLAGAFAAMGPSPTASASAGETVSAGIRMPEWLADGRADRIVTLIESGLNCPLTSSAGRMFDAVAALLGYCDTAGYEAQGAIRLETAATAAYREAADGAAAPYPYDIRADQEPWELDLGPAFVALLGDIKRGTGAGLIAARFHETVIAACAETAVRLCAQRGLREVVLSGGVFQNRLLLSGLTRALTEEGLTVHANSAVPCNDGGISLGQVAVALARAAEGEFSCA